MIEQSVTKYINQKNEETVYSKIKQRFKELSYILCKGYKVNLIMEIISIVFTLFQLLSFTLNKQFSSIWKISLSLKISSVLRCVLIYPILEKSNALFMITLYSSAVLLIFTSIIFIIILYSGLSSKTNAILAKILLSILNLISSPMFLPLFMLFLSLNACTEGMNIYLDNVVCYEGSHVLHTVVGIISAVALFLFSLFTITTQYSINLFKINEVTKKTTSKCDIYFLWLKAIIGIIYTFSDKEDTLSPQSQWLWIILYFFVSSYLLYNYYSITPYWNTHIMISYWIIFTIFLWSTLSLVISKFLSHSSFNSGIPIFLLGSLLMTLVLCFTNSRKINKWMWYNKSENELVFQINNLIELISKSTKERSANIILKGYITLHEGTCHVPECPWKEWIKMELEFNKETTVPLYQYIEMWYLNAIELYNDSAKLRLGHAVFLLTVLNKKKAALAELITLEGNELSIEEEFLVYKYIRYIESNEELEQASLNNNVVKDLLYKKEWNTFKQNIKKISLLFLDFWNIWLWSNQNNKENLEKLNSIGKEITSGEKWIEELFQKLQRLRNSDKETWWWYWDFVSNVVNNKENAEKLKEIFDEIRADEDSDSYITDLDLINSDILASNALTMTDANQFIIISSQPENFGIVINISLSLCSILGYSAKDIIGRNYNVLLPNIYIHEHNNILKKQTNKLNIQSIDRETVLKEENVALTDKNVFLLNSSRYLIEMKLKIATVSNEYHDSFFVAKIIDRNVSQHNKINVLVNKELIIQNFSSNAIYELGFNTSLMNTKSNIADYIKEFTELFLIQYTESRVKSPWIALKIKLDIQHKCYLNKEEVVTFKKNSCNEVRKFTLNIREQIINNTLVGYVYTFTQFRNTGDTPWSSRHWDSSSRRILNDIIINNTQINSFFIPSNSCRFNWDPNKMAFVNNHNEVDNPQNWKQMIKALVTKKINKIEKGMNSKVITESLKESSSSDYSSSESGATHSIENISNNSDADEIIASGDKGSICGNSNEEDYYQVNISKIHLSIYNFKSNLFVEDKDVVRISEVELKKNENNKVKSQQANTESDVETQASTFNLKGKETTKTSDSGLNFEINKSMILQKRIESALMQQDSQPTIINLFIISILSILIIIAIGLCFLMIFNISLKNLAENTFIIQDAYDLWVTLIYGYYYVVELNLYNYDKYLLKPRNFTAGVHAIQEILLDYYNNTNYWLNYIDTTFTPFSKNISNLWKMQNIPIGNINSNFQNIYYNLSVISAYTELNTALFKIATADLKQWIPTNVNNYYYTYNSANPIYTGMNQLTSYFVDNIEINIKFYRKWVILIFTLSLLLLVVCYFIITFAYQKVAVKKESYWEVFFDIEKNVLHVFIENCEFFNQKLYADTTWDTKPLKSQTSNKYEQEESNDYKETSGKVMTSEIRIKEQKYKSKKTNRVSKETQTIKLRIAMLMIWILTYLLVAFILFLQYLDVLTICVRVFENFYKLNITYLEYYNSLRNYMFDSNSTLFNVKASDFNTKIVPEMYSRIANRKEFVTKEINNYSKNFIFLFKSIYEGDICHYGEGTVFKDDGMYVCKTFLQGTGEMGLTYIISSYINELLNIKNTNLLYAKNRYPEFIFNWTWIGTDWQDATKPDESDKSPENQAALQNYNTYHQINVFNSRTIIEVNYVYLHFITPAFDDLKKSMKDDMNMVIKSKEVLFLWLMILFILINLLWFSLVWLPFVNGLNQIIYKTKNMLAIIPKQVLWNIPNICCILNINSNWIDFNSITKENTDGEYDKYFTQNTKAGTSNA